MEYISKNTKETRKLGLTVAKSSAAGDIIALSGDLGSGKTTFTKGFVEFFNPEVIVTSPTFVILKQYNVKQDNILENIDYIVHADCYRMESAQDADSVGLMEIINNPRVITLIEWPEKIKDILPLRTKIIEFEYLNENERKITSKK